MNKILVVTLAAFGLATPALAADLPARAAPPAPVPFVAPPVFTWTGFYAGVNAGYGWGRGSGTMRAGGASGPIRGSGDGFLGGVQVGYNWQADALVVGFETDFVGSSGRGTLTGTAGATSIDGRVTTPWGGTIRARVGVAMDTWMIYATGGAAYTHTRIRGTRTVAGVPTAFASSTTAWTWTLGVGVETALWDRWTVKAEYLFAGTPNRTPVIPGVGASGNAHSHILRAGMNYRF